MRVTRAGWLGSSNLTTVCIDPWSMSIAQQFGGLIFPTLCRRKPLIAHGHIDQWIWDWEWTARNCYFKNGLEQTARWQCLQQYKIHGDTARWGQAPDVRWPDEWRLNGGGPQKGICCRKEAVRDKWPETSFTLMDQTSTGQTFLYRPAHFRAIHRTFKT